MPTFPRTNPDDLAEGARRFGTALPSLASSLVHRGEDPVTELLKGSLEVAAATVLDKARDERQHAYELVADRCSPWLRRPIPSATLVAFEPPSSGRVIVSPSDPLLSAPVDGIRCTFRCLREVVVAACRADGAEIEARRGRPTLLRVAFRSTGRDPVNEAIGDGVTLYVDGDLETALQVVLAVTSDATDITAEAPGWPSPFRIKPAQVVRTELDAASALAPDLDGRPQTFSAFVDAAVCPDKFRFFRLTELGAIRRAPPADRVVLTFHLRDTSLLDARLRPQDIRTHCASVVNLFEAHGEPMLIDTDRGDLPIRVAGLPRRAGGVYVVQGAVATAQAGEHPPAPLPDVRRLGATVSDPRCPVVFATSFAAMGDGDPETTVTFGERPSPLRHDTVRRVASFRVLATNRALGGRLRSGDLAGELQTGASILRFSNVAPASPYIPPPQGDAFALRVLRAARVTEGVRNPLAALKDALFQAVPSWIGREEWVRAQHLRIRGLERLDTTVARRVGPKGEVRRGYGYRLLVDESAFRGPGDLGLFGATLAEAFARAVPAGSFSELVVEGRQRTFAATFRSGERS